MQFSFKVDENHDKQRLDLFLAVMQNQLSRSAVKVALNAGAVMLNGQTEYRPNYRVKTGDLISMDFEPEVAPAEIKPEAINLDIVYEDEHLLVINKEVGMVVHPATGNWSGTLMNAVLYHYRNLKQVGTDLRSGLIHRLDKDTSGLILIGKTNTGLWHYSRLFAERKVVKTYLAVVSGDFAEYSKGKEVVIENYLGRNSGNRKKMAVVSSSTGRKAITKFKFLKHLKFNSHLYSLVEAKPVTGRTHQIRVQLCKLGFPILGDVIYGRASRYPRLMLHAWKIKVYDLNDKELIFTADAPAEFTNLDA